MPKYLFTSDQRVSELPKRIKWVATYVQDGHSISNIADKSDNNNATTLKFYYNLHTGTKTCQQASINPLYAIRNFVTKFQFPNTRTPESLEDSIAEEMLFAPYRSVVTVLYLMAEDSPTGSSTMTLPEILFFLFCNPSVYKGIQTDYRQVISDLLKARSQNINLDAKIRGIIEWKQYERQSRELIYVLTYASSCFKLSKNVLYYSMNSSTNTEEQEFIKGIISYNHFWFPTNYKNYKLSNFEYISYMDTQNTPYQVIEINNQANKKVRILNESKISSSYRPYITAIKSKPFLLLAGISGTGKSRIVRELAKACWDKNSKEYQDPRPRNFEMVQVKPNWHDSSELIGYVSRIDGVRYVVGPFLKFMVKAIQDPETPYFLCLDEMNLAPVEQYFAEYLSVVESRKRQEDGTITTDPIVDYSNTEEYQSLIYQLFPDDDDLRKAFLTEEGGMRLSIPNNLIVVGTVNMDETTFSFSRKVLDRAMTIEMNEVDLTGGLESRHENIGKLGAAELIGTAVEGVDVYGDYKDVCDKAINYLQAINDKLEGTPFKIAYRTRNEVLLYVVNNLPYNKDEKGEELSQEYIIARALDEITNMKILSRIEGDETKVSKAFLEGLEKEIREGLEAVCEDMFGDGALFGEAYSSVSLSKLDEMKKRLDSGYTSFWS
ncbi:MAG: AAA family ATPase [Prevotellaceae bacterium]|nr:AAA family ATPase [Prevotellaceae bacterium]